jgi:hypothetical protein
LLASPCKSAGLCARDAEADRRRSLIESLFSSVKPKLSAHAPGRSLRTQKRQALLLGLSFNLYRLNHQSLFSRTSTKPSGLINLSRE